MSVDPFPSCHTWVSVTGIYLKKAKMDSRLKMSGMTRAKRFRQKPAGMTGWVPDTCHPDPFGKAQGKVRQRISLSRDIVHLGTDPSLVPALSEVEGAQDDNRVQAAPLRSYPPVFSGAHSPHPSYPQVVAGIPLPFSHTCVFVAGIHLKKIKMDSRLKMSGMTEKRDSCQNHCENDNPFLSSPQVGSGDPSERKPR
jgi:hypothetical protein